VVTATPGLPAAETTAVPRGTTADDDELARIAWFGGDRLNAGMREARIIDVDGREDLVIGASIFDRAVQALALVAEFHRVVIFGARCPARCRHLGQLEGQALVRSFPEGGGLSRLGRSRGRGQPDRQSRQ
jgi:hypothetical protein